MDRGKSLFYSIFLLSLVAAGLGFLLESKGLARVGLAINITALVIRARVESATPAQWSAWSLRARYKPWRTDAGIWVDAPVAELDKNTCGKLLASRLRRQPGLNVRIGTERPEARSDSLYDPELDG